MPAPKVVPLQITLQDGTVVRKGDKVRAIGECGGLRVCVVLEILKGCGVDKAILTAGKGWTTTNLSAAPFGTVIRTRYQIKPYNKRRKV